MRATSPPMQAPRITALLKAAAAKSTPFRVHPAPMPRAKPQHCNCRACQLQRSIG